MRWQPLGKVYATERWAQTPTPLVMADRVRVYFAERDERGKSFIRFCDLDLDDPTKVIAESGRVLENGKPGTFDDEGQMPSWAEAEGHNVELYYSGWNSRNTVPYHNASGIAYSEDGGRTFFRKHDGPWLDRTMDEPYLRVTPCRWGYRAWYVSGLRWESIGDRYEPIYVIRLLNWKDNPIAITQHNDRECFSRPWVMKDRIGGEDIWRMWYCYRSAVDYRDGPGAYRIGYAERYDEGLWYRFDHGTNVSCGKPECTIDRSDWDSTMQCYPAVFDVKGKRYMLFNGNSFGRYGFGLAVAE